MVMTTHESLSRRPLREAWKATQEVETSKLELESHKNRVKLCCREMAALQAQLNRAIDELEEQEMTVQACCR
jgi:hypothetical protein